MAPVVEMTRVEEEDPEGVWARRRAVVEGVAVEEVWCRVAGVKGGSQHTHELWGCVDSATRLSNL